ncbi:3'-5' exonuclease [Streptomyces avidinii]|uniref:UvrD-like helicase C-terminal domain-containing protein n=1 Tax=Streptomyces avidinii TaxID=1895 RepID=A0ABS4L2A4_STRAV|nr:3'-5' exonuclease [Streptomyces avidinii]MBP2035259.1 hypothetical protein [Streptomyces avidinii]GGZ03720.1 hypothetical protein GCM10010343_31990 [Streptomyces avidinii]
MGAGGASSQRAQDARRQERLLREQWQAGRRQALRWEAVGEGEQRVLAQLLVLTARGWRLLVHRQWSRTRTADADMLLVGTGGVFVIHVTADGEPGEGRAAGLLAATRAAESAVASLGMSPVAVQPLMVFAGQRRDASLGRIRLLGEHEIGPVLLSQRHRLRAESVRAIADHLERVFPHYRGSAVDQELPPPPESRRQSSPDGLFDLEGLRGAALEGALRVRLLHALVGDVPNGLLLVGDGQQTVYPGGFRLTDAGIDIRGDRGQVLRTNYRNSKQILDAALTVVADDAFEDLDGERTPGRRDVDLTYHDGDVVRVTRPTVDAHDGELLDALRALPDGALADTALLCPSLRAVGHYQRLLTQAGLPVCQLEHYDGRAVDAVKLGTYRRAKGLEFKNVFLPRHDAVIATGTPAGTAGGTQTPQTAREREELLRSRLFVAMTRARDLLWLGSVPS